ncbi:MAG: sulfotransferase domain-containing protein [Marinicellaceae bacterium]
MNNYLITGIPRSGTSLFLNLVDNGNRLCFSEPPWLKNLREKSNDGNQLAFYLKEKIQTLRDDIHNNKSIEIVFKINSKKVPDNYFSRNANNTTKTRKIKPVILDNKYSHYDFIIKANALFTANIKQLLNDKAWKIIPIVRDPLAVIMSWRSVKIASSQGRVKVNEKFSKDLIKIGQQKPLLKRQVLLLDWYFQQFEIFDKSNVVFYEDLISDPISQIIKHLKCELPTKINLTSKNNNKHYNLSEKEKILSAIKAYGKSLKLYYPEYN